MFSVQDTKIAEEQISHFIDEIGVFGVLEMIEKVLDEKAENREDKDQAKWASKMKERIYNARKTL